MPRKHRCRITGEKSKYVNRHHLHPRPYKHLGKDWIYLRRDLHDYLHDNYSNSELAHQLDSPRLIRKRLRRDGKID